MTDRFHIFLANSEADMDSARILFREYQQWLNVDYCFQDFESELESLPGLYAPPEGRLFLVTEKATQAPVACVAVLPHGGGRCELKRLYVRKAWRGQGLGRLLVELCMREAILIDYKIMFLDTAEFLTDARKLYTSFGFKETPGPCDASFQELVRMEATLEPRP